MHYSQAGARSYFVDRRFDPKGPESATAEPYERRMAGIQRSWQARPCLVLPTEALGENSSTGRAGPIFGWLMGIPPITLDQVALPAQKKWNAVRAERPGPDS